MSSIQQYFNSHFLHRDSFLSWVKGHVLVKSDYCHGRFLRPTPECRWGCTVPTDIRPHGSPPARECRGAASDPLLELWSSQSLSSKPALCPCGRGWRAESCQWPEEINTILSICLWIIVSIQNTVLASCRLKNSDFFRVCWISVSLFK